MATTLTKKEKTEKRESSIAALKAILAPGDTVWGIVSSVSKTRMSRTIRFYAIRDGEPQWITGHMSNVLGWPLRDVRGHDDLRVNGCGMDMIGHTVEQLSYALFGHFARPPERDPRGTQRPIEFRASRNYFAGSALYFGAL